jgi:hypothetical protein|tara:strand:+ start:623 stop:1582 length:960 start_codon:yes stop_codon:yes gene_type:complete
MPQLLQSNIEKTILENYLEYQYIFVEFQSKFLTSLCSRHQSIENGNLALYFAQQTHQNILRKKDYDLNFDLSFEKFWDNQSETIPSRIPMIKIGKDTSFPKETARRKILQLIKLKILNKKNRNIGWMPSEELKESYNLVINEEIDGVSKLISFICKKINISISREEIIKEIKEKFSFYWFHYLESQLEYIKSWTSQVKDRELILIFLQVIFLFISKAKNKNLSHKKLYDDPSLMKEFISSSISATSIADVTGIPRATCVRKLTYLVKLKIVSQDKISKRYYVIPDAISDNLILQKITGAVVKNFSRFFFICLRIIVTRT